MSLDVKNVVAKLGKLEKSLRDKVESGVLLNEVKRYADKKSKVLQQKVKTSKDVKKVVAVLEERRKQFEKVAKELPKEVKAVRGYIETQRKELDKLGKKLLAKVKEAQKKQAKAVTSTTKKKVAAATTKKKATTKKAVRK